MEVRVSEIQKLFADRDLFTSRSGDDTTVHRICAAENCGHGDLVFIDRAEFVQSALQRAPSAVVVTSDLAEKFTGIPNTGVLICSNVRLAQALIKQRFASRDLAADGWPRVHPSAVIHASVEVPESTYIGPQVVIGRDVQIGEHCHILAGAVIEHDAVIGDSTHIHPQALIGYKCHLGENVEVGPGTVIGSEGFGYAQDDKRRSHKIPQTGKVTIADDVRIGSNCSIDRAPYGETKIGRGTKVDNLCHLAHGVEIGEDCLLTAMLCVAGSTKIGDHVMTSGQVGILDHITVASDSVLVHRAGVTKSIDHPGAYAGTPTQPLNQYMKNIAQFKNLRELAKRVKALEKQMGSDS